jgi:hypothetical protein
MRGDFTDNEFKRRRALVAVLILATSLAPAAVIETKPGIWLGRTSTAVTPQADIDDAIEHQLRRPTAFLDPKRFLDLFQVRGAEVKLPQLLARARLEPDYKWRAR